MMYHDSWYHHLPHWHQDDKLQFITLRLSDSLPQTKLTQLNQIKTQFEAQHPKPWDKNTERLFQKLYGTKLDYWLDQNLGCCILQDRNIRKTLIDSFDYINYQQCIILAYVIMPNHIHIIMMPYPGETATSVLGSVKQYSSNKINKLTGGTGSIWQKEPFDRIIRNARHLQNCVTYIQLNGKHLSYDKYTIYEDREAIEYVLTRWGDDT